MDNDRNKRRILNILSSHPEMDTFELTMILKLPQDVILKALDDLEAEGLIEFIKN